MLELLLCVLIGICYGIFVNVRKLVITKEEQIQWKHDDFNDAPAYMVKDIRPVPQAPHE